MPTQTLNSTRSLAFDRASPPQLSIISALFQNSGEIRDLCRQVLAAIEPLGLTYEIILVDDCSSDATWNEMQEVRETNDRISVFQNEVPIGQLATIAVGLKAASGQWLVVLDCGLQHPPARIADFVRALQAGSDAVFGFTDPIQYPLWRRICRRWFIPQPVSRFHGNVLKNAITSKREFFTTFTGLNRELAEEYLNSASAGGRYVSALAVLARNPSEVWFDRREDRRLKVLLKVPQLTQRNVA